MLQSGRTVLLISGLVSETLPKLTNSWALYSFRQSILNSLIYIPDKASISMDCNTVVATEQ